MTEKSGVTEDGVLVSRKKWESQVSSLKKKTVAVTSKKKIKQQLKQKLTEAIEKRIPRKRFGLFLSGGVDSSLIAQILKQNRAKFICYSVGIANSKDVAEAKKAAKQMRLTLKYKTYSLKEAERIIKKSAKIIGKPDVVNVGVAAVEIAAASLGRKDKINSFFSGLGSEEIFAGYQRHAEAQDVNKECWRGLKKMYSRDLIRDFRVASAVKINFFVPYLDSDLITTAMAIPGKYKINKKDKKVILREIAVDLGLPKQFAFRKKLAAQYGSGFDKAISKIAKRNGFRYKKEYLKSIL